MKHSASWTWLSLAAAAVAAATAASFASAQVQETAPPAPAQTVPLTRNPDALRALAPSLRRITATPAEQQRLERAVAAGDEKAARAVLLANGFSPRLLSRLRVDLRGPRGSDEELPGTIYLTVIRGGGGSSGTGPALRLVKVGPNSWISWELIWRWITGEF
jgi:hypothetical protein